MARISNTGGEPESKNQPAIRVLNDTDESGASSSDSGNERSIGGIPVIDPASGGSNSGESGGGIEPRKRRGRPKGSKNRNGNSGRYKTEADNSATLDTIKNILQGVHLFAAVSLSTPELNLDEAEAEKLTNAIANVAQYYDVTADPKTLAWWNLACVAGGIYFTRGVTIYNNRKKKKPILVRQMPQTPAQAKPEAQAETKPNGVVKSASKKVETPSDIFGASEPDYDSNVGEL